MLVGEAKEIARRWVLTEAVKLPNFAGAYLAGSILERRDDELHPPSSDVDIMVVLNERSPPAKPGKFIHQGALLEASYLPADRFASAELALCDYHLAPSFRASGILADPTGRLGRLGARVSEDFAKRRWVMQRCAHAREAALRTLRAANEGALEDRVFAFLFGAGIACHVLLVAGLRNPTVRRRYAAVRALLIEQGRAEFHEELLETLGCADIGRARVEQHLAALAETFDATEPAMKTAFPYSSDLTRIARPIAIDGSEDLIASGLHREAVFWIAVTFTRCRKVLSLDAPDLYAHFTPRYGRLLGDLGIETEGGLAHRAGRAVQLMPRVWTVAEAMALGNPAITG